MKITLWKRKGNRGRFMAVRVIFLMANEEVNDGTEFFLILTNLLIPCRKLGVMLPTSNTSVVAQDVMRRQ